MNQYDNQYYIIFCLPGAFKQEKVLTPETNLRRAESRARKIFARGWSASACVVTANGDNPGTAVWYEVQNAPEKRVRVRNVREVPARVEEVKRLKAEKKAAK